MSHAIVFAVGFALPLIILVWATNDYDWKEKREREQAAMHNQTETENRYDRW